jgi:3,2-trans-enoyl-CoA isomerase
MTDNILSVKYALNEALAIVSLHREPVNSMNTAVWTSLLSTLDSLEANPKVRGVVFTSALKRNVFTAGNDLTELYPPSTSMAQFSHFWVTSNTFLARLYVSPLFTVAAVKGACPAGGCCLAMCCDFRIVTKDASMGLNEVAIGISVPPHWIALMCSIVGQGTADKLTQYAKTVNAEQALKIGLVDEVVDTPGALEDKAILLAKEALQLPDAGRGLTKSALRGSLGQVWADRAGLENEAHKMWEFLTREQTIKALKAVMARLSKPKARAKM